MSDSELDGDAPDVDGVLELPALGDDADDDGELADEGVATPELVDDGGDPLDDSYADDVPLDVEIATDTVEPSAVDDDASGLDGSGVDHEGVHVDEEGSSMIDEGRGHAEEGLEFGGDEELGLDPIPTEVDDGGLEGLDEQVAPSPDAGELPPLDGAEDDDEGEDIDLGIDLAVEPAPADDEDRGEGSEP